MPKKSDNFKLPYAVLVGLVLIRFLPLALGTKWLWGVSHLTILPIGYWLGYGLFAAGLLVLPFTPKAESWGAITADWFNNHFLESKSRYLYRALWLLLAGLALALFAMPTHFLGDGYTMLSNVGVGTVHILKWSEGGAMLVANRIAALLGERTLETAKTSYQLLSILSGLITTWFYFLIAKQISPNPAKRLLTFVVLFFSATLLLFFGYVESYPIMWGPLVGFLYFSLKYSIEGKGIFSALICLLIAGILHLQIGMYIPAFGFLFLSRGAGHRLYAKFRLHFQIVVGLSLLLVATWFVYKWSTDIAVQFIFLFPFHGKPLTPDYAVFSARHLADLLNLFLMVSPLGFLILAMSLTASRPKKFDPTIVYLALLTVGSLLFLFLVDPGLAMPRDWDLFSSCGLAPILLLLYMIPEISVGPLKRLMISVTVFLFLTTGAFLLVNLDKERSIAEIEQIITNNKEKSFGTLSILRLYYSNQGDQARVDSLEALRRIRYPDFYRLREVFGMTKSGDILRAEEELRKITPNPYSADYHQACAELYLRKKNFDSALIQAQMMVRLAPKFDLGYVTLSSVYFCLNKTNEAMGALHQGLALNPESVPLTIGLCANFMTAKQFDSAIYYGKQAAELNPNAVQPYFYLAQSYDSLGQKDSALESARKFIDMGQSMPDYAGYRQQLYDEFPVLAPADSEGTAPDTAANP